MNLNFQSNDKEKDKMTSIPWIEIAYVTILYALGGFAWFIGSFFHQGLSLILSFVVTLLIVIITRYVLLALYKKELPNGENLNLSAMISNIAKKQKRRN